MNLSVKIMLNANDYDPTEDRIGSHGDLNESHVVEFNLNGDNLNGPSSDTLSERFFKLAQLIKQNIKTL